MDLHASKRPTFISFIFCLFLPILSRLIPGWLLTYYVAQTVFEVVAILLPQFLRLQEWITMSGFGIKKKIIIIRIITFTKVSCSGIKNSPKAPLPNTL